MASFEDSAPLYDAIVVGLGGHGSAALAHLSSAMSGGKVLGIERFEPAHGFGSSHGKSRIYRQAYFEHPMYVPLLQRALELWRELQSFYEQETQDVDQPLLNLCGGLMIGRSDREVVAGTLRSIREHDLPHEILTADQIHARFPMFHPEADEIGVYEANAGTLNPEKCILAHLLMARKHGASVQCGETFLSFQALDGVVTVTTDKGEYKTKKLVLAVGSWAPALYNDCLPFKLHLERRELYWFRPTNSNLDWKKMPVYIWDLGEVSNFYGFPEDSTLPGAVKIAKHGQSSQKRFFSVEDMDREVREEDIQGMREVFQRKIPELDGELVETATCMYTMTPDEHFLLDLHPQHRNIVLVSPCSGHGYKFCSVVGEIVKDLVLRGETAFDLSLFRLDSRQFS